MKLYHGSNVEIDKVDLSKCMPNKDFGCGFYTTLLAPGVADGTEKSPDRWWNTDSDSI